MDQFEKLLKQVEGYEHEITKLENGEVIIRLIPVDSVVNATSKKTEKDKAKYFTKITEKDREKVKDWLKECRSYRGNEKEFLERVDQAVHNVNYDYCIATMEPSVKDGKIYYAKNKYVGRGFSCYQWKQMAKNYYPERGSRLASLDELFIWYALRIVNGDWTLNYVVNDSSSAGNYWNAPNSTHSFEKTGARKCGGYYDGQGNTYKIVTIEDGYALVGGDYGDYGDLYPVAGVDYSNYPRNIPYCSSGVLSLTK